MITRDLIEELLKMDPEREVVMQDDSEGNGYRPCSGADDDAFIVPGECGDFTVYHLSWSAEDAGMDEDEWQETKQQNKPCVVIYPSY